MDDETRQPGALKRWVLPSLVGLGVLLVLWSWAGVSPQLDASDVRASGPQYTTWRDDGQPWRVTSFRPGSRAEVVVGIRRQGPLPMRITGVSSVDAGPPPETFCGWWPDRVSIDGQNLAEVERGIPLARDATSVMVLSGRFLGSPGCLDEGRVGGRRLVFVDASLMGAPKRVRVDLPVRFTWSTSPQASAEQLARRPVDPRVGTAP